MEGTLNVIVPLPHMPLEGAPETAFQVRTINPEGLNWLRGKSFNDNFIRDAAAVLCPGNSAILLSFIKLIPPLPVLAGFSSILLHASLSEFLADTREPPEK
jgi:hypothetical protein